MSYGNENNLLRLNAARGKARYLGQIAAENGQEADDSIVAPMFRKDYMKAYNDTKDIGDLKEVCRL